MAISEPFELDGVTITSTALSIVNGNTTPASNTDDGAYQVWVDGGVMAKADEYQFLFKEKVEGTGGTQKTFIDPTMLGVQAQIFMTPVFILINGWDALLDKLAGVDRAFDASIRKIA